GYSRTDRLVKLTAPISSTSSDSTVANTGRRMEISGNCIEGSWPRSAAALAAGHGARIAGAGRRDLHRAARRAGTAHRGGRAVAAPEVDHAHRRAVLLDALLAGGDHHVAGVQALGDLHLAGHARADGHLHALGEAGVLVGAVDEPVDELLAALRHDRLLGDH